MLFKIIVLFSSFASAVPTSYTNYTRNINVVSFSTATNGVNQVPASTNLSIMNARIIGPLLPVFNAACTGSQILQSPTVSSGIITGGTCAAQAGGGGGSAALGIYAGATQVSSPTAQITFDTNTFNGTFISPATAYIQINSSSVTLQGNTFNGISQLVQTTNGGFLPSLDGSNVFNLGWGHLTGFPSGCTGGSNFVHAVGTTLTCQQPVDITGNSATATALQSAGTTAGSGYVCRGVDASGNCLLAHVDATTLGVASSTQPWSSGAANTSFGPATAHGVMLGEGSSALSATSAGAADTLLQGQGASSDPAYVSVNSCSAAGNALIYNTGTHAFGCNTGFLTANQSITLSGDASGSGTTAITVTNATVQNNILAFGGPLTDKSSMTVQGTLGILATSSGTFGSLVLTGPSSSFTISTTAAIGSTAVISISSSNAITIFGSYASTPTYVTSVANTSYTWISSNVQFSTLTANTNIWFPISGVLPGERILLNLFQDSVGSRTVTWDPDIMWAGGSAPTLTTTASQMDVIACEYLPRTAHFYCVPSLNFSP